MATMGLRPRPVFCGGAAPHCSRNHEHIDMPYMLPYRTFIRALGMPAVHFFTSMRLDGVPVQAP